MREYFSIISGEPYAGPEGARKLEALGARIGFGKAGQGLMPGAVWTGGLTYWTGLLDEAMQKPELFEPMHDLLLACVRHGSVNLYTMLPYVRRSIAAGHAMKDAWHAELAQHVLRGPKNTRDLRDCIWAVTDGCPPRHPGLPAAFLDACVEFGALNVPVHTYRSYRENPFCEFLTKFCCSESGLLSRHHERITSFIAARLAELAKRKKDADLGNFDADQVLRALLAYGLKAKNVPPGHASAVLEPVMAHLIDRCKKPGIVAAYVRAAKLPLDEQKKVVQAGLAQRQAWLHDLLDIPPFDADEIIV